MIEELTTPVDALTFEALLPNLRTTELVDACDRLGLLGDWSLDGLPPDLRGDGILQWLDWAPGRGHQLADNIRSWNAYDRLRESFGSDADSKASFLRPLGEERIYELLDDEAMSNPKAQSRPWKVFCSNRHAPLTAGLANVLWTQHTNPDKTPAEIAGRLNEMPEGYRVLRGNGMLTVCRLPVDAAGKVVQGTRDGDWEFPAADYPVGHLGRTNEKRRARGVLCERWANETINRSRGWLEQLQALAPKLDGLMLDVEEDLTWWDTYNQTTPTGVAAIDHLRAIFPEVDTLLGFDASTWRTWRARDEKSSKFNELFYTLHGEDISRVAAMVSAIWPEFVSVASNYEHSRKCSRQPNGNVMKNCQSPFGVGALVHGHGGKPMYGGASEKWDARSNSFLYPPGGINPWNVLRSQMMGLRAHQFASKAPWIPFITCKARATGMQESDLYQESLIHGMMANPTRFIWGWFPSAGEFGEVTREQLELLDGVLEHVGQVVGLEDRRPLPPAEIVDYGSECVISRMDVGGAIVWRITGESPPTVLLTLDGVVVSCGSRSIAIPRGEEMQDSSLASAGVWIRQSNRVGCEAETWRLKRAACAALIAATR